MTPLDKSLIVANPTNKQRAAEFIDSTHPHGSSGGGYTDPIQGLELALSQQPQILYLLTDGLFPDNEGVMAFLRKKNASQSVRVCTVAFVSKVANEEDKLLIDMFRQIAKENGGTFRAVSAEDWAR